MNRKNLAVKSSIIGVLNQVIIAVLGFVCRKFFLQYIGTDILGINGTISQLVGMLTISELGFQTAIIFKLYKPLAGNDHETVSQIMMLLRRVYIIVGIAILIIGFAISFFLKSLITKVDVNFSLVYILYFIMLIETASSYWLSYQRAVIQADQKLYIINVIDSATNIIASGVKILCVVVFKSAIMYVLVGTLDVVCRNIISYGYYRKQYGWIDKHAKPDKGLTKELLVQTKNVFLGKITGYVFTSTDNLVISALVGTSWVGLVGNYSLVSRQIEMLIGGFTLPILAMLGNIAVTESQDETEQFLNNFHFIRVAVVIALVIPSMCLSDAFVRLLYGEKYVLSPILPILLAVDLILNLMQGTVGDLVDAVGFFKQEKNILFLSAVINLSLSIIGAAKWGIIPVFVATIIGHIVSWIGRACVAYKYYFKSRAGFWRYWRSQFKYVLYITFSAIISYVYIKPISNDTSIGTFVLCGICIEIVNFVLFCFLFRRKTEFKFLLTLIKSILEGDKNG